MKRTRIACFYTGGYTELNGMTQFLRKIKQDADFIKLVPNRERRNKEDIRNRTRHMEIIARDENGLTGSKLIEYIKDFVQKDRFKEEEYDVILIEDDKDDRFLSIQEDGTAVFNDAEWQECLC